MVQSNQVHYGQAIEQQQTSDIASLRQKYPQEEEMVIVEIYYNQANEDFAKANQILEQKHPQAYFG